MSNRGGETDRRFKMAGDEFAGLSGRPHRVGPEKAILFLTSHVRLGDEACRRLAEVVGMAPDWSIVHQLATAHGVAGLLRAHLLESGLWAEVPIAIRRALDGWQIGRRKLHVAVNMQLRTMLAGCREQGIVPIVLKGPAIAATAYPDPAVRSMADLDLLIAPDQMEGMAAVLGRLGYRRRPIYYTDEFNATHGYHHIFDPPPPPLAGAGGQVPVELHWELASRPERRNLLSAAALSRRTRAVSGPPRGDSDAARAFILTPEAQLVYLSAHAASEGHAFGRLIWLVDIAAVIGAVWPIDWCEVVAFARQSRTRTATFVVLTLARNLVDARVPKTALEALHPSGLTVHALDRVLNPIRLLDPVDGIRRAAVKYTLVDSQATTARLVLERLLPAPAVLRTYYPDERLSKAYARHAIRTLSAGVRTSIRPSRQRRGS